MMYYTPSPNTIIFATTYTCRYNQATAVCLKLMNRTYDRAWYLNRIDAINRIIPGCAISTDVITGFCTETEEEHQETLSMMDYVQYYFAYMFMYSESAREH